VEGRSLLPSGTHTTVKPISMCTSPSGWKRLLPAMASAREAVIT